MVLELNRIECSYYTSKISNLSYYIIVLFHLSLCNVIQFNLKPKTISMLKFYQSYSNNAAIIVVVVGGGSVSCPYAPLCSSC